MPPAPHMSFRPPAPHSHSAPWRSPQPRTRKRLLPLSHWPPPHGGMCAQCPSGTQGPQRMGPRAPLVPQCPSAPTAPTAPTAAHSASGAGETTAAATEGSGGHRRAYWGRGVEVMEGEGGWEGGWEGGMRGGIFQDFSVLLSPGAGGSAEWGGVWVRPRRGGAQAEVRWDLGPHCQVAPGKSITKRA